MVRKTSEYIWWMYFLFVLTIASSIKTTHGCQMDGVIMWPIPVSESILDTHAGYVLDRGTTDIEDITTIRYGEGLNAGPYLEVSHAQNRFQMWVNDAYRNYEENEVAQSMSMTVTFRCTGGTTNTLVFLINVIDTNNNAPQFRPNDIFEYVITTPLAPGFLVTGCFNNIVVRDIDLTTQRIDFGIEENPYIDIAYDSSLSTTPKEFKAVLRTKTFIRTIPELLTLQISATDVDLTGDPPRTTYATVHIKSDPEFEFPEEPVFSRAFYLANYDEGKITHDAISLRQGFDDQVQFSLDGDYATNFQLNQNGNQITLSVRTPLSNIDVSQILLIVKAEREYTSGASATVIVQLPEEVNLEFERAHYSGQIENNILRLSQLTLIQGFEGSISARIIGEHASYFSVTVQGNSVTITMAPLTENIIRDNNFIYLEVIVSAERGLGSAVVTLEIIKDDNTTPVFSSRIYTGNYDVVNGLNIEPIYFVQGYDDSVSLKLDGDSSELFEVERDGAIIKITSSALPVEIHSRSNLILSLEATKPRTVGANAAIVINLPEARELIFEESTYKGTLQDNILTLETIVLSVGYQDDVSFNLIGEYKDYFATSNVQNRVALSLLRQFPESVILANSLILLTLEATGQNAVTTTTNVLLEIIKEDLTTPLFSRKIYYGSYIGTQTLDIENINLVQGFDDTVTFRIEGEHSQFFAVSNIGNNVVLSLRSQIPSDVIYSEKVFSFNVIANKALTVGANAAILIRFPAELTDSAVMRFSRSTYVGSLENERLSLENIVLDTGYADDTQFELTGEYESYFTIANRENTLTVSLITPLPSQVMEANDFLVLEIEASRDRAISATTSAIIHIIRQEIIHPVFSEAYYRGVYTETRGLEIDGAISLSSGYDDTVTFKLEGESARWFTITQNNNLATVALLTSIPQSVLNENTQLLFSVVAAKPNAISGRAILSIDLPRDSSEVSVLRFAQNSYIAFLQNGVLESPNISLENSDQPANINIIGDYESYFRIIQESNVIRLTLVNDLPIDIINNNNFIVLNLEASYLNAISGYATIIIDIITDSVSKTPVFSEAYYFGEYSEQTGLVFEHTIRLIQGFDENVSFTLSGDDAQWFRLVQIGPNNHALSVVEGDLRIRDKCKLLFNVVATKAGSLDGQVAVVISLKDYTTTTMIRFTRDFYKGAIDGNTLALNAISLEGYSSEVTYSLIGDYAEYFQLNNQNGVFTLHLGSNLPDSVTSTNNVLVLTVEAQLKNLRTHTTVVLEIITKTDGSVSILKFEEAYYLGSYSNDGGLNFEHDMRVTTNLDDISFNLNGDNAQWFGLVQNQNSVSLKLKTPIPSAVIANNRKLVFTLTAQRPGSALASATVIISLVDEYTDGMSLLGFERVTYVGSIEDNTVTLDSIALTEGFSTSISFTLFGELIDFFTVTASGSIVSIGLQRTIPEDLIPANRVIVLELRASAPQAVSAYTTIVLTIARDEDSAAPVNDLVFDSPHYTGSYSEMSGLVFETPISLSQGYDTAVQFSLEGDNAQWFSLIQNQNSISLTLRTPIPTAVITNNRKLIFSVAAQRPGSITIRTTIIISLIDEPSDGMSLLGFERVTYVGSIEDNTVALDSIALTKGFSSSISFTLFGELVDFFTVTASGSTVTIGLHRTIPEDLIPANRVIVLELRASASQAVSAYTTIVLTIARDEDSTAPVNDLVFDSPHYTGSYSEMSGLVFETPISLSQGYDAAVQFSLEGDNAQWFSLIQNQNSISLTLRTPIPTAVITNNRKLIFSVAAQRPGSITIRTTIIISLIDEPSDGMSLLGFERVTYVGSIEDNTVTLGSIALTKGFSSSISFTLFGELVDFFTVTASGSTVTIGLHRTIPEDLIPANRVIVLELRASASQAVSAYTTIVLTIARDEDSTAPVNDLVFDSPHYTGSYSEMSGLVFETPISLSQGYDAAVQFSLEGDNAQWFSLIQNQNSISLTLRTPIPTAVITNNRKLIFSVAAQRPGSITIRTTIIISLIDEPSDGMSLLGFQRVTYVGSIEDNTVALDSIALTKGFSSSISFTLFGELVDFFTVTASGSTVTIGLHRTIPEDLIPANRVIVLELRASASQAVSAYTTIVLTIARDEDSTAPVNDLVFDSPHYTGSYSEMSGLVFETPISLSQGYDAAVQFSLEGDNAQWFSLIQNQNSISLTLRTPIPTAVITNNRKLIFSVAAQRPGSITIRTTIIISLIDEPSDGMSLLGFQRVTYVGSIEDNTVALDSIALTKGFSSSISFTLFGELVDFFTVTASGSTVTIGLHRTIPEDLIPANRVIVLELRASASQAVSAYTTIVLTIARDEDSTAPVNDLVFDSPHYTGSYSEMSGLVFETPISLSQGYDTAVQFSLEGDNAQWFSLIQNQNSVSLTLRTPIPTAVIANNRKLIFSVAAQRPGSITIRTTIIISLIDEPSDGMSLLGFERVTYVGSIEDNTVTLGSIALTEGFSTSVSFTLFGELVDFFTVTASGSTVTIGLHRTIPEDLIPDSRVIVLELRASAPQAVSAYTTIVLTIARDEDSAAPVNDLVFDSPHYTGSYSEMSGLVFETPISLSQGYDAAVQFSLEGDNAQWFSLIQNQNSVSLTLRTPIPTAVIANNRKLIFSVAAQRPGSITIRTTIIISLSDEPSDGMSLLGFERVTYVGSIEDNTVALDSIALTKGFSTSVSFTLFGELVDFFTVTASGSTATIGLHRTIPEDLIPSNRFIVLELRASAPQAVSAYTTIVLTIARDEDSGAPVNDLVFDSPHYTGSYTEINGLVFDTPISLSRGYDEMVIFYLEGDNTQWFNLVKKENIISLTLAMPIPSTVLANNRKLIFNIAAQRPGSVTARATIIILLLEGEEVPSNEYFDKVLYEGLIQGNIVRHEQINLFGFLGENIRLIGEYASLFGANVNNGVITIQLSGSIPVPTDVTLIALELHALRARSVLLLTVESTENPNPPLVVFGSSSYALRVEITRTGLIGRVHASADNGEAVTYSLRTENVHLVDRLSVNNDGELHLSAPASSGVYTFEVVATTVFTRASALAIVHLTVDAATICGDDLVMPPLLVIDRDEESPHRDLVALNPEKHEGCRYTLTNRWPVDQTWLYVDDTGLHTRAIDREHESIAFMKVSQVQVELILHCANDKVRSKRSIDQKTNSVDDYGSNHWILTDSILYNSRRSFVNLIVNDINDNAPVFVGKENEPIAVGYPISDLEEVLRPRSLAELKASDADIGENAVLRYWSHEPAVVVSPTTGFVHVRSGARLQDNQELTVHATDRNGEGLTGHIKLLVKLLDVNNIAVVTVQNSFLDDEIKIISQLSTGVGYEVKALRSDIISDAAQPSDDTRKERDAGVAGTTMQLYIYGLNERQPVSVERLITDINNIAIIVDIVANAISLEDHLEGREICVIAERDTGLLIACILLSILLFIIIVVAVVWSILKRRKSPHYSQFSDKNSIASRTNSLGQLPKTEAEQKPRLYIEDLRKSERKLQEILDAPPLEEVKASTSTEKLSEPPTESIIDIPVMEPSLPIVIQSIDKLKDATDESDDDEFGENKKNRRKSVVTFNENVEKIIHVEDDDDSTSVPGQNR